MKALKILFPGFFLLCAALLTSACTGQPGEEEDAFVVPPEKADNFMSLKAQEYVLEGTTTVTIEENLLDEPEDVKLARVHELIPLKQIVIGWFLNQYVKPHDSHSESEYGGSDSLTTHGSYEDMDIQAQDDGLTYSFRFRQELGGPMDLLEVLPTTPTEDGKHKFDLTIGKISNSQMARLDTNYEWYRSSPWSDFDPSKVDPSRLETVTLTIWAEPRSVDSWIDYNALYADGVVTMAIYFGWDYHNDYHLKHSRDVYDWLIKKGYTSPVESYDDYTRTSGPLTRTIQANGKALLVKIWLHWGKPGTDTDPDTYSGGKQLEDDMREDFRTKEVIAFSGHSGPFYGFALANWRKTDEGDLDDSEIPGLDMPSDVYQVVMAEGCETYALGQAFWDNPNKPNRTNLDILTTTSFSNASTPASVEDFITAIAGTKWNGDVQEPETYGELLRNLDTNSYWFNTMYGVHGLDDNPHLHPYANPDVYCTPCNSDAQCGQGHKCARLEDGEKYCFAFCTADDGCPDGYKCLNVASGYTMQWKTCVPENLSCQEEPPVEDKPTVMLNEILADPPSDVSGDANQDGERDASKDEFVEIYNYGNGLVNLQDWVIADSTGTRFTFPAGATLMSGEAAVVFGGGNPPKTIGSALTYTADVMLGLNNRGDTVSLIAPDGTVVDSFAYGRDLGGWDSSMVRATDGDPEAEWILHSDLGTPFSAGTKSDGSSF